MSWYFNLLKKARYNKFIFLSLSFIDSLVAFIPIEIIAPFYFKKQDSSFKKNTFIFYLSLSSAFGMLLVFFLSSFSIYFFDFQEIYNKFFLKDLNLISIYFLIFIFIFLPFFPSNISSVIGGILGLNIFIFFFLSLLAKFLRYFIFLNFFSFLILNYKYYLKFNKLKLIGIITIFFFILSILAAGINYLINYFFLA